MMWLILIIIAIGLFMLLRKKPAEELGRETTAHAVLAESATASHNTPPRHEEDDDELIAVFMAAIQQLTGSSEYQIVKIQSANSNWRLTGRQDIMNKRL